MARLVLCRTPKLRCTLAASRLLLCLGDLGVALHLHHDAAHGEERSDEVLAPGARDAVEVAHHVAHFAHDHAAHERADERTDQEAVLWREPLDEVRVRVRVVVGVVCLGALLHPMLASEQHGEDDRADAESEHEDRDERTWSAERGFPLRAKRAMFAWLIAMAPERRGQRA